MVPAPLPRLHWGGGGAPPMPEFWYSTGPSFSARPALVLDASAAARPFVERQIDLVRAVAAALAPDELKLFVLGHAAPIALGEFVRHAGRGRVIAPVIAALGP